MDLEGKPAFLAPYNPDIPTNSSNGFGAMLCQKVQDYLGTCCVCIKITYWDRTKIYIVTCGCEMWSNYFLGKTILIEKDPIPLVALLRSNQLDTYCASSNFKISMETGKIQLWGSRCPWQSAVHGRNLKSPIAIMLLYRRNRMYIGSLFLWSKEMLQHYW